MKTVIALVCFAALMLGEVATAQARTVVRVRRNGTVVVRRGLFPFVGPFRSKVVVRG